MRDKASVNNNYCYAHTQGSISFNRWRRMLFTHHDHVGGCFDTPTLNEFNTSWISLLSHSPKTRLLWKSKTDRSMSSYSSMRWWSGYQTSIGVLVMLSLFAWKWRSWSSYSAKIACFFWWPAHKSKLQIRLTGVSPLLRLVTTLKATVHLLSGNKPPTHPLHEQWVTYARASVQDGIDYFNNQLSSSLKTFGGL